MRGIFNHTNTTGCHVGGNHDGALARLEFVQDPVTFVLLFVAVDGKCRPSVLSEEAGDFVRNALSTCEDQDLVLLVVHDGLKVLAHPITLLEVGDDLDDLLNAVVGGQFHGTNVDLNKVLLEVSSKLTNLLGPGCRPHASLTIGTNLANDFADLGLETHVKHTVGLVENQVCDTAQVGLASLKHVNETTGCSNADLDTAGEITDLRALGHTSVDTRVPNAGRLSELADLALDLDGQLTGRGEDQDNRSITR